MIRRICVAASAVVACMAIAAAIASADAVLHNKHLSLDSHSAGQTGHAGPELTTVPLESGSHYVVTVSGTYSAYGASLMNGQPGWHMCGRPVAPSRRSPDLTGQDAELIFATPKPNAVHCPALPRHHANLQMSTDGGSTYAHVEPTGGTPSAPSSGHAYTYVLIGRGQQAAFRLVDSNTRDNYGKLAIDLHRAKMSDCAALHGALGFASADACRAALPQDA
jgi:hypothetical protein